MFEIIYVTTTNSNPLKFSTNAVKLPYDTHHSINNNAFREFVGKNFKKCMKFLGPLCHCAPVMGTASFDMYEAGSSFSSLLLNEWIEFTFYILYLFYLYVISNKITIKIVNPIYDI